MKFWCSSPSVGTEEEVQQLRDLVLQLKADNEWLLHERAASLAGPTIATLGLLRLMPRWQVQAFSYRATGGRTQKPYPEKCPMFSCKTGMGIAEWTEEIQACMHPAIC